MRGPAHTRVCRPPLSPAWAAARRAALPSWSRGHRHWAPRHCCHWRSRMALSMDLSRAVFRTVLAFGDYPYPLFWLAGVYSNSLGNVGSWGCPGGGQWSVVTRLLTWRPSVAGGCVWQARGPHMHTAAHTQPTYDLQNGYQSTSHDLTVLVKSCKFGFEECSVLARCLVYWLLAAGGRVLRLLNK